MFLNIEYNIGRMELTVISFIGTSPISALFRNKPRTLRITDDLKIGVICLTQDGCWAGAKRVHVLVILGVGLFVYIRLVYYFHLVSCQHFFILQLLMVLIERPRFPFSFL